MKSRTPAEVFPPGEFLKEELDARGWTQTDLAEILGRPTRLINEIINAKRGISPETARGLADAFGTSAEYWLNLESAYQLSKVRNDDDTISHRARLYGKAPIKEMVKRNWIETSSNTSVLEQNVLQFLEINSLDEEPNFLAHAARKSTRYDIISPTPQQMAWLFRSKHLSKNIQANPFTPARFNNALEELRTLIHTPEEARHVPRILSEGGVRFLIVEALPQTKIDGACFWLDSKSPVVVVSMRYDRIDYFWHTLMHELGHVRNKDGLSNAYLAMDTDLFAEDVTGHERPQCEIDADRFAVEYLVPQNELEDFILRVSPIYPKVNLVGFANLMDVHPGIVLGQLQHRDKLSYARYRELLVKVRDVVTQSSLTDGFGNTLPAIV